MPCVGALHPNIVGQAVDAGAAEVRVLGCPPDDCGQREGNLWLEGRLNRTRLPRLKRQYAGAPIRTAWVPPNESGRKATGRLASLRPVHFLRGGLLLALVLALQVAITDVPYQPYRPDESLLQLGMRNAAELRELTRVLTGPELAELSHDEQVEYLSVIFRPGQVHALRFDPVIDAFALK